jgi:hypothetical protein
MKWNASGFPFYIRDPIKFGRIIWPDIMFYPKQEEVIWSVVENDETFVPAGNMLGKDFVAAFIALWFFLTRYPVRVVTTSADYAQLESVLWGEVRRYIETAKYPLDHERGGSILINHLHLRKVYKSKGRVVIDPTSYMIGRVAAKGEGMLGHHVEAQEQDIEPDGSIYPRTLFICDEASGADDITYERADTWARRKLIIGNPYPCANFFFRGVKGGDLEAKPVSVSNAS